MSLFQPQLKPRPQEGIPLYEPEVAAPRLRFFALLLALAALLLLSRLWYLQILKGHSFRERAMSNRASSFRLTAPRGLIEDVRGRTLVTNGAQFVVSVLPTELSRDKAERAEILARLASLLGLTDTELQKIMDRNRSGASDPIPVAEDVNQHTLARLEENRIRLPGVVVDVEPVRRYSEKKMAAHLLGYIGKVSPEEVAANKDRTFRPNDLIGKGGIEQQYDVLLKGTDGSVASETDAKGRRRRTLYTDPPQPGATLRLTILRELQTVAENALQGKRGAVVAIDPRNGQVLAMASAPSYDPNILVHRPLLAPDADRLYRSEQRPLINRAISEKAAPGSTFKIVTTAAGLAKGTISPYDYVECRGSLAVGKREFHCHHVHGSVNLQNALAVSCDIFFYRAGLRIQPTTLAEWAENFGLGHKTGIDLPGEKAGYIPSPEKRELLAEKNPKIDGRWYQGMTANMAIGQGEIQTTPLQMALVAAGIANHGIIYRPQIVQKAFGARQEIKYRMQPEKLSELPLTPAQLQTIATGMRGVVEQDNGTSKLARIDGIVVAGKSGSAELKTHGLTNGWFICYAGRPGEAPSIAMCVFLETLGKELHGGADAAPLARAVMVKYFQITKAKPTPVVNVASGAP